MRERSDPDGELAVFDNDIAIVGMAGRFPGAPDVASFWRNLREGVESVTRFSDADLLAAGVPKHLIGDPDYVKVGAPLADMEMFDAALFGLTPREAAIMDPQHRTFLECAWEAIEDAGYDVSRFAGPVGVFGGSGHNAYLPYNLLTNPDLVRSTGMFMLRHTGNDKDFLTTRLSYLLNLKGPSVAVQTACSTSLVAIHLACQSLLALECDMALAGGVTIELPHRQGYLYEQGGVASKDGHCRPFDHAASGTVFGSGAGMVVLRRLSDALASGDHIYALIKGSAINNDGSGKVGYFAPSVDGQANVIVEALTIAGVAPDTISYVEAHGTGTPVGDPIEIAALTQAFRTGTDGSNFCAIGSLKGNVGHLDTAAGVASLIKVAMALQEKELPPSINFDEPNEACGFEHSPFRVARTLQPWIGTAGAPRRAGVNALGVGGTNAHVVLEQAPTGRRSAPSTRPHLLVVSAASSTALDAGTQALGAHLAAHPELDLGSVEYTLQVGRTMLPHRRCLVVENRADAVAILCANAGERLYSRHASPGERNVALMFAGGGAQHPNMGRDLYRSEAVFRDAVDQCIALLADGGGTEIRAALYPAAGAEKTAAAELERPSVGLPALFITQYAQAQLWRSWGVVPSAMIGHSMGEYVAAHLAGVFSLRDALLLVQRRGQLFEQLPPGAMLSVPLGVDELAPLLNSELSIAAINGAKATVVSGPGKAITALRALLLTTDTPTSLLRINVAAHSAMLEPLLPSFAAFLATIRFQPPNLPFLSSLTGTWITAAQAQDPTYWVRHLRETVRFHDGLAHLLADDDRVMLEVGPGRVLTGHALQHPKRAKTQAVVHSSRHVDDKGNDVAHMLDALGRLWAAGAPIFFGFLQPQGKRLRVPLPTYRFDHLRHWIEPGRGTVIECGKDADERSDDIAKWFYRPTWTRAVADEPRADAAHVLIFADRRGLGERLAHACAARSTVVSVVRAGRSYGRDRDGVFTIRPDSPQDMARLIATLASTSGMPDQIFHLWSVSGAATDDALKTLDRTQTLGFYSVLHLAQAIASEGESAPIELVVVSDGIQRVCDERALTPTKATVLGPCRVIPRELPNVRARSVDIVLPARGSAAETRLLEAILAEPFAADGAETVALRHGERWVQRFEPVVPRRATDTPANLKPGGVYVITGGLGEIGLAVALHLANTAKARIALLGRRILPPREAWPAMLADDTNTAVDSVLIRQIRAVEEAGGTVLTRTVDIADVGATRRALRSVRAAFGPIDGVFHAAGMIDDQLLQLKDAAAAARVLAPKVRGTLSLRAALRDEQPDFLMLFSSVSASLGAAGQVDYAGANAFLDAFAQASEIEDTVVMAVDWSQWREIGMAAALTWTAPLVDAMLPPDQGVLPDHPWLDRCLLDTPGERRYTTRFDAARHWLLDEHRVGSGTALIPGTGFLELVRAAAMEGRCASTGPFEINDVLFLEPFFVNDAVGRDLEIVLQSERNDAWQFVLRSRSAAGTATTHVRGRLHPATCVEPDRLALAGIRGACGRAAEIEPSSHMHFGPRWANVTGIDIGDGVALIALTLPAAFTRDLETLVIHPALLDMATAGAQILRPGLDPAHDFFVPASYGRVRLYRKMVQTMFSYVRLHRDALDPDVITFDVTICDARGVVIAEVNEFTMLRVGDHGLVDQIQHAPTVPEPRVQSADAAARVTAQEQGILPPEGLAVIEYLLTHPLGPQIVVSPQNFVGALARARTPVAQVRGRETRDGRSPDDCGPAMSPTEQVIAELWRDMLGVETIVPTDNFFDLGGHSLLAMQFVNKLRKRLGVPVPATAMIETPSLAALAARFSPDAPVAAVPGGVNDFSVVTGMEAVLLSPGRPAPPLFLVHDGIGEILLYRTLAQRLEAGRPVYGLAPAVRADGSIIDTEIASMAAAQVTKVRAIQSNGPYLLAGLCAGGVIAFEMARQFEEAGDTVWYVGIIDAADVAARERPFFMTRIRVRRFLDALNSSRRAGILAVSREILGRFGALVRYEFAERARKRGARREVKQLRGAPAAMGQASGPGTPPIAFLEVYKIAHREHRPTGLLNYAHVVLYRASHGNGAHDDMPFFEQFSDCALGWGGRVADDLDILPIPGGHVSALQEPHVSTLAEAMQDGISRAVQRGEARSTARQSAGVIDSEPRFAVAAPAQ